MTRPPEPENEGWYTDPEDNSRLRWWNAVEWTDDVLPGIQGSPDPTPYTPTASAPEPAAPQRPTASPAIPDEAKPEAPVQSSRPSPTVPPGWYPQSERPGFEIWWSGDDWDEESSRRPPPSASVGEPNIASAPAPVPTRPQETSPPPASMGVAVPQAPSPRPAQLADSKPTKDRAGLRTTGAVFVGVILALFVFVGGCIALIGGVLSSGSDGADQKELVVQTTVAPTTEPGEPGPSTETDTTPPDPSSTLPELLVGTRENPLATDQAAGVIWDTFGDAGGSVWNTSASPLTDVTAGVMAENQFNNPPAEGMVFAGFDLEMTLAQAQKVPLAPAFNVSFEVVGGSSAVVHDGSCGVIPDEFDLFHEAFIGGSVDGLVCVEISADDLAHPDTLIALNFSGNRVFFSPTGQPGGVADLVPLEPSGSDLAPAGRANPLAYGSPAPLRWDVLGDADESIWETTVGRPTDITAAVLAENQFNSAPAEGMIFIGYPVTLTLQEAAKEPLSVGFNIDFELVGGDSREAHTAACGVVPGELDVFAEVFAGGTLNGTICVMAPISDLDHPETTAAIKFNSNTRAYFGE